MKCKRCKLSIRKTDESASEGKGRIHWPGCPSDRHKKIRCPYCRSGKLKAGYRDGVGYVECKDCKATTYFNRLASTRRGDFVKLESVLGLDWEQKYETW